MSSWPRQSSTIFHQFQINSKIQFFQCETSSFKLDLLLHLKTKNSISNRNISISAQSIPQGIHIMKKNIFYIYLFIFFFAPWWEKNDKYMQCEIYMNVSLRQYAIENTEDMFYAWSWYDIPMYICYTFIYQSGSFIMH